MNVIATILATIFGKVGDFLIGRLGARLAVLTAVIAAWVAAAGVFTVAANALIMSVALSVPSIVQSALACLPSNTGPCIAAIGATHSAAWVYAQVTSIASVKGRV